MPRSATGELDQRRGARRFAYTHESSLPIKNYRAEIDLSPAGEGTA